MKMSPEARAIMHEIIGEAMSLDYDEFDKTGICYSCGETRDGVEPDASGYKCYECGKEEVSGIMNAVMDI